MSDRPFFLRFLSAFSAIGRDLLFPTEKKRFFPRKTIVFFTHKLYSITERENRDFSGIRRKSVILTKDMKK